MNKFFNRFAFVVLALILFCGQARAQFTTTFAKNASPGQQNGLYYSLPQTMLQLDFVIRETVCEPGPLSDYADMYFENESYVDYQTTTYELLDVRMASKAAPDPNNPWHSSQLCNAQLPPGTQGTGQGPAVHVLSYLLMNP